MKKIDPPRRRREDLWHVKTILSHCATRLLRKYDNVCLVRYGWIGCTLSTRIQSRDYHKKPFIWIKMAFMLLLVRISFFFRRENQVAIIIIMRTCSWNSRKFYSSAASRKVKRAMTKKEWRGDMSRRIWVSAERSLNKFTHSNGRAGSYLSFRKHRRHGYTVLSTVNYLSRRPLSLAIWCKTRKAPLAIRQKEVSLSLSPGLVDSLQHTGPEVGRFFHASVNWERLSSSTERSASFFSPSKDARTQKLLVRALLLF